MQRHKENSQRYTNIHVSMEKEDQNSIKQQAETIFADLLDSTIMDVASEAHRTARLNLDPRLNIDEEEEYRLSIQARISVVDPSISGSKKGKHGVDVFGQTHPAVAAEVLECMNCNRNIMAGRFAPHLEKCLGKGRRTRMSNANTQKKIKQSQKAATVNASRISTRKLLSDSERKPTINGGKCDDNHDDNDKMQRQVQGEALKRSSRRSSRRQT